MSTKKRKKPDPRSRVYIHAESTRASQVSKASTSTRSGQLCTITSASPIVAPPLPPQDEEMVDSFYPDAIDDSCPSPCPSGITVTMPAKHYLNSVRGFLIEFCIFTY